MGKKCHIFNDWIELNRFYEKNIQSLNPSDHQIFIYQGAHGIAGGSAKCNSGPIESSSILKQLKTMATKFKTAAVMGSCYSGDLLSEKIVNDTVNDPALPRLCIATGSTFGNVIRLDRSHYFKGIVPGENMEDVFMHFPDGLISSAAWDDSGTTDYFRVQNAKRGIELLKHLTSMEITEPQCQLAVDLCSLPVGSVEMLDSIFYTLSPHEIGMAMQERSKILGSSPRSTEDQIKVLHKILGMDSRLDRQQPLSRCANYHNYTNVIRNFTKGSLKLSNFESPLDQKRRQACRDFKFEDSGFFADREAILKRKLLAAIENDRANDIGEILNQGAATHIKVSPPKSAALFDAVRLGRNAVVAELLKSRDIDVNYSDPEGWTSLHLAAINGNADIVDEFLKKREIKVNHSGSGGMTPLLCATVMNHPEIVDKLLKAPGIDLNQKDQSGQTALGYSAEEGRLEIVKSLVKSGADIEEPNKQGCTPLAEAAWRGHLEVVEFLIKEGADPTKQCRDASTIAELARHPDKNHVPIQKNQNKIIELLDRALWARKYGTEGHVENIKVGSDVFHHSPNIRQSFQGINFNGDSINHAGPLGPVKIEEIEKHGNIAIAKVRAGYDFYWVPLGQLLPQVNGATRIPASQDNHRVIGDGVIFKDNPTQRGTIQGIYSNGFTTFVDVVTESGTHKSVDPSELMKKLEQSPSGDYRIGNQVKFPETSGSGKGVIQYFTDTGLAAIQVKSLLKKDKIVFVPIVNLELVQKKSLLKKNRITPL